MFADAFHAQKRRKLRPKSYRTIVRSDACHLETVSGGVEIRDESSPFLQQWKEEIWAHYGIAFDDELFLWAKNATQWDGQLASLNVWSQEFPTAHETIEAQFVLRQWCRNAGLGALLEELIAP